MFPVRINLQILIEHVVRKLNPINSIIPFKEFELVVRTDLITIEIFIPDTFCQLICLKLTNFCPLNLKYGTHLPD